jgi:hypothetical protein
MKEEHAIRIAISTITGHLISPVEAKKILDVYQMVLTDPDSFTIKKGKEIKNGKD